MAMIILLVYLAQVHSADLIAKRHSEQHLDQLADRLAQGLINRAQYSIDSFVDKIVDNLFNQALKTSSVQRDSSSGRFEIPSRFAFPSHRSHSLHLPHPFSPHPSLRNSLARVGYSSEDLVPRKAMPRHGLQADRAIVDLTREVAETNFVKAPFWQQAAWYMATASMLAAIGATGTVPVSVRLVLASVIAFSNFEYCFHRWVMHAPAESLAHRTFGKFQDLHVTHHRETLPDMQLECGDESDPRHIYFSMKTTLASIVISTGVMQLASAAFDLGFDIPSTIAVSTLVALVHTSFWQTLHGDIHDYCEQYDDGLPRVQFLSSLTPYTRWMVTNHVGHHVVGGRGNYNIVFPGPDYLWGTSYHPKS
eukprot:gnl/MRDRNA2_/MRDRNA2_113800_c0_seq1.p1 gnl/MRDRNA2_/MRDRNA2_113800_c0~~gnl/MRDRNA2_/MRDRNA2_113800_c0_seq1.p1  ORF type:complete len:364 (-),score=28.82 gnl/MRDRNA2_/MRDRNA2_113800_c0_seq1:224-1315(-)